MSDLNDTGVEPATTKEDLTPSVAIVNGIYAYGPFILAGWIAFEIARRRYERAYYCRDRSPDTASPTLVMTKNSGYLGWIWPLYTTTDDTVLETCGMDTLFFLRFLRMCQKIAWMGILCSVALFPIYYYGVRGDKNDVMYKMTLSHLNPDSTAQSWRFWFTVLAMYIMSAWTCYLLYTEFLEYVRRRHAFLSRKTTQQYTVVINGLPKHLQTQQTLRNYLEVLFPGLVEHVYVAIECGDLEKLVAERVKVRNRLEHVLAQSAMTGERVFTSTRMCGGEKVDAIQLYEGQLKSLNEAVEMEVRAVLRNQAALANQMLEGDVEESDVQVSNLDSSQESAYIRGLRKDKGDMKKTRIMRDAGLVTFNKLRAAQVVQQVLQCADPTKVQIEAAPDVDDIVWENIGISYNVKQYWGLISLAATVAIILFWTIPTSSVVALSKVDKLKEKWAGLRNFADKNPWISPVLEQISPLMLSVMNALAPIIFGILSKREGHASAADIDNSLFNKLVAYQWFLVFLLPVLGTTFLDSLLGKGEKLSASKVIHQLSVAVPIQSSFFIAFLMVQMGLPTSLELLRVVPIMKSTIYRLFAPQLTPRERTSPWFGLTPVDIPGTIGVTDLIAQYFLVLILILVFATVAPILPYFAAAYLFLSDLVYRWNVLCISDPSPNTGSVYFPALYRYCIAALLFAQVLMATLLGLKKAAAPATFVLILPGLTALFHLFVWSRYPHTALNLPLDECVLIDNRRHRNLEDLESVLEDVYKQPAMAQRAPLVPDYANLTSDPKSEHQLVSPPENGEVV